MLLDLKSKTEVQRSLLIHFPMCLFLLFLIAGQGLKLE